MKILSAVFHVITYKVMGSNINLFIFLSRSKDYVIFPFSFATDSWNCIYHSAPWDSRKSCAYLVKWNLRMKTCLYNFIFKKSCKILSVMMLTCLWLLFIYS